ncbi:MAG: hypothetical protein Q4A92_06275 [Corynebacterium sp.]|nr:hypothetical protein [Corynebacterium sp.]
MRVYIPATFELLGRLHDTGMLEVRSGWGFAVTPALRDFYTAGDEDEMGLVAFDDAARASIRMLSGGTEVFPQRRVVVTVEVPESQVSLMHDMGESVVRISPAQVAIAQVVAIHVDIAENEPATAAAIEVVDAADLGDEDAELTVGDALDNLMAWYDPVELPILVALF